MSRLQAGAMAVQAAHGRRSRRSSVAPWTSSARRPRWSYGGPADAVPDVEADPGLLERVLVNLLANACGSPRPTGPGADRGALGDHVVVPGSSTTARASRADQREQVFLPFQRLGDTDNTTGVGLGLALSRGLTEAMGGTLRARGHPGGGLTMVLRLRAGRRTSAGPSPACGSARRVSVVVTRVLVVDDEPQILRALAINLRARGYDVRTAGTGTEALAVAADHAPELVVLDLGLPDMDGTEVIAGLRGWTAVPILVLSGRSDSTDKVEALDAGADDYVTKPFGMDELLARMRAMVRRAGPAEDEPATVLLGENTIDLAARKVLRDGDEVRLTPTEWHLLEVLVRHPGTAAEPAAAARRGVGTRLRDRAGQPAPLHGPAAPQAGARPGPAAPPAQRARDGLPLRALTGCRFTLKFGLDLAHRRIDRESGYSDPTHHTEVHPMQLPHERGPISRHVIAALTGDEPPPTAPALGAGRRHRRRGRAAGAVDDLRAALPRLRRRARRPRVGPRPARPCGASIESRFEHELREGTRELVSGVPAAGDVGQQLLDLVAADDGPSLAAFLQRRASREQVLDFLRERSVQQLKESDPQSFVLPRLDGAGQGRRWPSCSTTSTAAVGPSACTPRCTPTPSRPPGSTRPTAPTSTTSPRSASPAPT